MQCTSVRLLLNLVEVIFVRRADVLTANDYRVQLARILDAFICKLSVMKEHNPKLLAACECCMLTAVENVQCSMLVTSYCSSKGAAATSSTYCSNMSSTCWQLLLSVTY